ncbi:FAD-binding protein [Altererythrobacter salegens]|uniref:FAD-binding protein n=1 Tax=Croceibacterium salegens TaxID=1737568 RepID=A0A6I4SYP7_9SPHN|nr:FAD-dependent monooxygenase [Croceibacterium salegens]MXO59906.1 FAD-binding protein [Croceibacterium salegens]
MGDCDVLVVGGGPTGFVTALGLAQAGVSVCLIEAGPAIISSPRACVYHWSMLDGLERLGIREEAERIGYTKDDYLWLRKATGEEMPYDLKVLDRVTRFNYNIQLGQDMLADICLRRLQAMRKAEIRWNTAFTGLVQDADGVTVGADGPDGPVELRAKWVVGADGASSSVRQASGLSFDGMTWPERFVATNVRHDFESGGYWQSTMVIDEKWGAVIVKITRDGLWRCTFMEDMALPEESYLDRIPDAYANLLPGEGGYELVQSSPYKMHQRCASTFRLGRTVLAGDAAHVTNPTGGFGLTTGLFDAYSLWPTLAAIVLDGADPALLDTWAEERRAIFLDKTSPQACAYKDFVFHACGGSGERLDAALDGMRRMVRDPDYRLERLMFTKGLETTSPAER